MEYPHSDDCSKQTQTGDFPKARVYRNIQLNRWWTEISTPKINSMEFMHSDNCGRYRIKLGTYYR